MSWNLSNVIICLLIFLVGYQLGRARGGIAPRDTARQHDPNITDEQIRAELRAGRKIDAIKLYRQRSGCGLKQAKEAVEAMDARMGRNRIIR